MNRTIVTVALLALTTMVSAQEVADAHEASAASSAVETITVRKAHFGFLSYDEALKSMPEYIIVEQAMEDLKNKYNQEMARAEQEFTKKYSEYIDGQRTFPENIMLKRQKELQQLMDQSLAFKNEAKETLAKAQKDAMEPLYKRLNGILKAVGTSRGYSYILNTDGNTYPFINTAAGEGEDITEIVKMELNKF